MINTIFERTQAFIEKMPKAKRKEYGQFFTSVSSAEFMASLAAPDLSSPCINILDAGAGAGILSVAQIASLRDRGYKGRLSVSCYETDNNIIPLLNQNLKEASLKYEFAFKIIQENYITSQTFSNATEGAFDIVIGNPPYKKIPKDADEAKSISHVCYGAPNLYFLFWAMGINNLKSQGELVYIIPRSWTSGAYFERFRQYLLNQTVITNIHLFGSRKKVFKGEAVLQETMIIRVVKNAPKPSQIKISFSETSDLSSIQQSYSKYETIVGSNSYIYLPVDKSQAETLEKVNRQRHTLLTEGMKMKTGIVVDFRTREVLRDVYEVGAYPLFYSQHIKNGRVSFPINKEGEFILTDRASLLQKNTNYVFVKRFTAKEEKRRLQCGIVFDTDFPQYEYISTQNKINFIECATHEEALGIYAIFNSTLYDTYYRILNGSTQVNSTEINNIPIPDRDTITLIGKELAKEDLTEYTCDKIVERWIK